MVIALLAFSLLRERRHKREALQTLLYEHETLCLAIEGSSAYAWRLEGDSVSCDLQFCELIHRPTDTSAWMKSFPISIPTFARFP